jgi:hypothetical protein
VKIPLGIPGRGWENNSRMILKGTGCEDVDCTELAQVRDQWRTVVNTVTKFRVP